MFNRKKKQYDLILSLGGSCATSKQLRLASLQFLSFPFDWLFHIDASQLCALKDGFQNSFSDWLQQKNLKELIESERGASKKFQYKDTHTEFRFIHDFDQKVENNDAYHSVFSKYQKRLKRLEHVISQSKKVMFIIDTHYDILQKDLYAFLDMLFIKSPDTIFDIIVQNFNANMDMQNQQTYNNSHIQYISYIRKRELVDFAYKNSEWNCLKNLRLSWYGENILQKQIFRNIFDLGREKKKLHMYIFKGYLPNILRLQLRFMSIKLDVSLGRVKD